MVQLHAAQVGPCVLGTNASRWSRYTLLESIGQGSYGVVRAARDEVTHQHVAIKHIEGTFDNVNIAKRTLRELRILQHLHHENVIGIKNVFLPGSKDDFQDIHVVYELMETDFASILKSSQTLTDDHHEFFVYQILRGMKYVHSAGVVHRDLKPRNLLVNGDCELKICDFGLARVDFSGIELQACPMTEYVCTRWYRAPEILCSWGDYSKAIDVWSIGCIFAEMFTRKALFMGTSTRHQIRLIVELLGTPREEEVQRISNDRFKAYLGSLPATAGKSFKDVFQDRTDEQLDLLGHMLQFDPDMRTTAAQALLHPCLAELCCPEDEPTREAFDISDFEFERRKVTIQALRHEMYAEAVSYYPGKMVTPTGYKVIDLRLLEEGETHADGLEYLSDEEELLD